MTVGVEQLPAGHQTPFVGRVAELAALHRRLLAAEEGRGGLVLLAGEPGIGKTRTAEELAAIADRRGTCVLWGRCFEGEGAPAFWPWAQVLRGWLRGRDADTLRAVLRRGAGDVALLVPELGEQLPDLPPPPDVESPQARFQLFDSVAGFLRRAAAERPLLVVLDDLHWADAPSLLLLEFVATQLADAPILLVGTYRDVDLVPGHRLGATLGDLTRRPWVERIHLGNLSPEEVAEFVEATRGVRPAALLAGTVLHHTDGNPLFVGEMLRLLASEDAAAPPGAPPSRLPAIPPTVREAIERRLGHLSETCRRALAAAAVVGREFDLAVLRRALAAEGVDADAALEALDEAEAVRIVAPVRAPAGRYRFSHALIRETLYDGLPTNRRARLHGRIGEAIEALHGPSAEARLAELAHHFVQAAAIGDPGPAIAYARRAAEQAVALLAYEEGARLYEVALQLVDAGAPATVAERCDLLLALGEARSRAVEDETARDALVAAAELARSLGSPERLARAALGFGGTARLERGSLDSRGIGLLEEALAALGDADSADRARVMARLATARPWCEASPRDAALSQDAVDLARRIGDQSDLADALAYRRFALGVSVDPAQRLALASEMAALAQELGKRELLVQTHRWRIQDLLEAGARPAADAAIAYALRHGLGRTY